MRNAFRYFDSSPEVRLTVMMYIRYPLSLRQEKYLLFERGIDICHVLTDELGAVALDHVFRGHAVDTSGKSHPVLDR